LGQNSRCTCTTGVDIVKISGVSYFGSGWVQVGLNLVLFFCTNRARTMEKITVGMILMRRTTQVWFDEVSSGILENRKGKCATILVLTDTSINWHFVRGIHPFLTTRVIVLTVITEHYVAVAIYLVKPRPLYMPAHWHLIYNNCPLECPFPWQKDVITANKGRTGQIR
jgi:hypothetical protein